MLIFHFHTSVFNLLSSYCCLTSPPSTTPGTSYAKLGYSHSLLWSLNSYNPLSRQYASSAVFLKKYKKIIIMYIITIIIGGTHIRSTSLSFKLSEMKWLFIAKNKLHKIGLWLWSLCMLKNRCMIMLRKEIQKEFQKRRVCMCVCVYAC